MMTFTILLAIAAGIVMLQMWEGKNKHVKPVHIKSDEQLPRRYRGRR